MAHPAESVFVDSRQRLIEAAREAFLQEGYRASVDRIAARAGVAKQTLYNHFASKDDLFSEVARLASSRIAVSLEGGPTDVRECLLRFAAALRTKLLSDEGLAMFRVLVAEAVRFPALAKAFYEKGPQETARRLAVSLERAMAAGQLRRDDPGFAAEMLIGMLVGAERTARMCGLPVRDPADEDERIHRIIDTFLRAYAPEGTAP